jgi:UDP-glucose 4-epimerase
MRTARNGSKILITGAKGFIGRHLARHLAQDGHLVTGVGHGAWPEDEARSCGVHVWMNGEIRGSNLQVLATQLHGVDTIFHLAGGSSVGAAIAGPREDFARTVATTAELLEWVRLESPGTRVIAISSAAVYGGGGTGPLSESTDASPCSPYGYHKLMMEQLCRSFRESYGLEVSIARLFSVYGSGLRKQLLWDLCSRLSRAKETVQLGGTGAELRDWTEIRDVARALGLLATSYHTDVFVTNVGTGVGTSVGRIAELVIQAWPHRAEISFNGTSRPGDPFSLVAGADRLGDMGFDWTVPVEQGVSDYVKWFLSRRELLT